MVSSLTVNKLFSFVSLLPCPSALLVVKHSQRVQKHQYFYDFFHFLTPFSRQPIALPLALLIVKHSQRVQKHQYFYDFFHFLTSFSRQPIALPLALLIVKHSQRIQCFQHHNRYGYYFSHLLTSIPWSVHCPAPSAPNRQTLPTRPAPSVPRPLLLSFFPSSHLLSSVSLFSSPVRS